MTLQEEKIALEQEIYCHCGSSERMIPVGDISEGFVTFECDCGNVCDVYIGMCN